MNRWLLIGSLVGLMVTATGCASCSTGGCASGGCQSGNCGGGMMSSGCGPACGGSGCQSGNCGVKGALGTAAGLMGVCKSGCGGSCGRVGCETGRLGWQSGGLDYSSHLQTGLAGHNAAANLNSRPFTPGPPSGQTAYPYYTTRGPRDFLQANPPSIGR